VRFRLVAALADTVFQRELIISEEHFLELFPDQEGYRVFLLNGSEEVGATLEESLADYGFDVKSTSEQLAEFHRVENTYLSTFQTLGALGLLLGTVGLAVVLLRNVLERRRELALLRAVGYKSRHLALMVLSENVYLLLSGLAVGAVTALIAIAPAFVSRGGGLTLLSLGWLLVPVLLTGALASVLATVVSLRSPLLEALRAE
jgi:ABC-type antimicrobial peptide transport system permease subunit